MRIPENESDQKIQPLLPGVIQRDQIHISDQFGLSEFNLGDQYKAEQSNERRSLMVCRSSISMEDSFKQKILQALLAEDLYAEILIELEGI